MKGKIFSKADTFTDKIIEISKLADEKLAKSVYRSAYRRTDSDTKDHMIFQEIGDLKRNIRIINEKVGSPTIICHRKPDHFFKNILITDVSIINLKSYETSLKAKKYEPCYYTKNIYSTYDESIDFQLSLIYNNNELFDLYCLSLFKAKGFTGECSKNVHHNTWNFIKRYLEEL